MMDKDRPMLADCLQVIPKSVRTAAEEKKKKKEGKNKKVKTKQNRFSSIVITTFARLSTGAWLPGVKEERLQIAQRNINRCNRCI